MLNEMGYYPTFKPYKENISVLPTKPDNHVASGKELEAKPKKISYKQQGTVQKLYHRTENW